jgi:hypothetical protein
MKNSLHFFINSSTFLIEVGFLSQHVRASPPAYLKRWFSLNLTISRETSVPTDSPLPSPKARSARHSLNPARDPTISRACV